MLYKAKIMGMAMDPQTNAPIIILKTEEADHTIPIWIGLLEATSIASKMQDIQFERPMTHDLFKNFSDFLDIQLIKVEVCDLHDNTFFALIHFDGQRGPFTMDARPSDAIALALRFDAPIYVDQKVIEKSDQGEDGGDVEILDKSEEGKKWAEYLEKLTPDDFGKFKV
jgi:bifunctional DNase/RNase